MDHILSTMVEYPKYYESFNRVHQFLLRDETGPLPHDYRCVIAIMAAGRHQCCCLMNEFKYQFVANQGDLEWKNGLTALPMKLQNLYEVNKLLAHRPWLVDQSVIKTLLTGDNSDNNWSLAELAQALVLLIHFHALSTFHFASGAMNAASKDAHSCKDDAKMKFLLTKDRSDDNLAFHTQDDKIETSLEKVEDIVEQRVTATLEELDERFENVGRQAADLTIAPQATNPVTNQDIAVFIRDLSYTYQDFMTRGQPRTASTLRSQDYSWAKDSCSVIDRLYNGVGEMLDVKFKIIFYNVIKLSTNSKSTIKEEDVKTLLFRRAIWNYIHCLFGIRHDDYDYNEVNRLLDRNLKTFIKKSVCYPERITVKDIEGVMGELTPFEKIHLNLLIMEGRMQAQLLYTTRALSRYMSNSTD